MDLITARARIHAMFTASDEDVAQELDRRIDDLLAASPSAVAAKPSFWQDDEDDAAESSENPPGVSFFKPGHTYAARVGWPNGRERFRFICESVTTDPGSGEPRALGQHGRRGADGEWIWTPNPRTYDDWRGGAWTDITDELA